MRSAPHRAFFLVGATATGKTAVAHILARRTGLPILSADAMLVYRGMDIGTAKPSAADRAAFHYAGTDLAEPGQPFSTAGYLAAIRPDLDTPPFASGCIAVGGTGLYVRCLIEGLDLPSPEDPALRAEAAALLASGGVTALQERVRMEAPGAYARLADPQNPRRLIRAWENRAAPPARPRSPSVLAGLRCPMPLLEQRIRQRAEGMFREGLLDEARRLRAAGPLSATAAQAIGYAEAFAVLDGRLKEPAALDAICLRTRQLAKRQNTWFSRQHNVMWIEVTDRDSPEALADRVQAVWKEHGTAPLQH